MTLKVSYERDAVLKEIIDSDREIARLRDSTHDRDEIESREDRVRPGELIGAAVERLREHDVDVILSRVSEIAARVVEDELKEEFMVVNASFLVARERLDEFGEEIAEEGLGRTRFVLLGPMPRLQLRRHPEAVMGMITQLVLAPLAPLRLTLWVSEKVHEETVRQTHSPGAVIAQLRELDAAAERGEITQQEARERAGQIMASWLRTATVNDTHNGERDG